MEPYLSGIFALAGTFLGIIGSLGAQWFIQRHENKRAMRKLAYEAALRQWEATFRLSPHVTQPLFFLLRYHLLAADRLDRVNLDSHKSVLQFLEQLEIEQGDALARLEKTVNERKQHSDSNAGKGENP